MRNIIDVFLLNIYELCSPFGFIDSIKGYVNYFSIIVTIIRLQISIVINSLIIPLDDCAKESIHKTKDDDSVKLNILFRRMEGLWIELDMVIVIGCCFLESGKHTQEN